MRKPQARGWWRETVRRWKKSGLSAREFGALEGVSPRTLTWWSSTLRRGTRAKRGSSAIVPIEIAMPRPAPRVVEIATEHARIRVEVGTDLEYVAELVRRLGSRA